MNRLSQERQQVVILLKGKIHRGDGQIISYFFCVCCMSLLVCICLYAWVCDFCIRLALTWFRLVCGWVRDLRVIDILLQNYALFTIACYRCMSLLWNWKLKCPKSLNNDGTETLAERYYTFCGTVYLWLFETKWNTFKRVWYSSVDDGMPSWVN